MKTNQITLARPLSIAALLLMVPSSHADTVYVSNQGNNTIVKFDSGGVGSVFASGLSGPEALAFAFDGSGNLYAANAGNNTIVKLTPGGVSSIFANTGLNGPVGL